MTEDVDSFINKKIPKNNQLEEWNEYRFIESPFVEIPSSIKIDNRIKIISDLQYPKYGMENAINKCIIRKEALERLLIACILLPENCAFKIWDTYRTWELQNEIYFKYKEEIIEDFDLNSLSVDEQEKVIGNYVSIPNNDERIPPLHTTGGSIDLTITNIEKQEDLDLGIQFDDFSDLTNSNHFENYDLNETIRDNRRLLYNTMINSGFTNLPSEIWHYDYGNRAWGYYNKRPAIYEGCFKMENIKKILSFDDFLNDIDKCENYKELQKYKWN